MQEHHEILRNEKMKSKLDENGQYNHQKGQLPTQPLVSLGNLFSIYSSMPPFEDDQHPIESDIPRNDSLFIRINFHRYECRFQTQEWKEFELSLRV